MALDPHVLSQAFFMLDIFPVLEHVTEAVLCLHGKKSGGARKSIIERLKMLLTVQVGWPIGGIGCTGFLKKPVLNSAYTCYSRAA